MKIMTENSSQKMWPNMKEQLLQLIKALLIRLKGEAEHLLWKSQELRVHKFYKMSNIHW